MRIYLIAIVAVLLCGCEGEQGPAGVQGPAGEDGTGYEFQQFGGSVPTSGSITITVPFLRTNCPPIIQVYIETTPGNWIPTPILDTFDETAADGYLEMFVIHDGSIEVLSASSIAFNRPIPFIVTMFAPEGYFTPGYTCQ